jgi:hypothetical protein
VTRLSSSLGGKGTFIVENWEVLIRNFRIIHAVQEMYLRKPLIAGVCQDWNAALHDTLADAQRNFLMVL